MGISMKVAVAVMVGSFRATVVDWVSQTLKADLFVAPEGGRSQRAIGRLPEEAVALATLAAAGRPARLAAATDAAAILKEE
jgi:hypothetical protein